ncbi:MAG TPA: translocation/assembly module TamB domain-containing protein, partial [Polyangiaceae bacterium]|nr:translocation/assembly module TamB domain-containing protein [Polyangiaceae bacterium]
MNVQAHVTGRHPDQIDLHALIVPGSERLVRAPLVLVQDGLSKASVTAQSISVAPRQVRVQGLQLTGPGRAELSFTYGRQLEELALQTTDLDVGRLLSMFGVVTPLHAAKANLEARLSHQGRAMSGKLTGQVRDVSFADLQGSAHADLTLEQDRLDGTLGVTVPSAGATELRLERVTALLAAPSERDLEQLTGKISMEGQLQLERLSTLLPLVGLERGRGQLRYRLELGREAPGRELPSWKVHVETRNLELVGQRQSTNGGSDPDQARRAAPWSLRGVDLNMDAALDDHSADIHGKLFDRDGDLARLQASLRDLDQVRDWRQPTDALLAAPFDANLELPVRPLEHLPDLIRPAGLSGKLALELKANGTLRSPSLQAHAKLQGFGPGELENEQLVRLDWDLSADYAQSGGHLAARAERARRALLNLESEWTGDARQLAAGVEGPSPIQARLALDLHDFPVHALPALELRHVQGALSGSAHVDGLGKDARLALDLQSSDLSVSRSEVGHLETRLQGGADALELHAQIHGPAGDLSASLDAPWQWGKRLLPSPAGQLQGQLETRGFQLSALLPLVEGSISELAGQLDSHFSATFQGDQTQLSGEATLAKGLVNLPNLGQRFSDISAKVTLTQEELRVEELRARGVTGAFDAKASVQLDHLVPAVADASLHIKEKEKLPISVQGETMGEVWGGIDAHYQRDAASATQSIQVDLQKLNIQLPESNPRSLASLDQPSYIRVGYIRQDKQFAAINLQPIEKPSEPSDQKTLATVNLNSVTVQKGDQVRVVLGGKVSAQLAPELSVQGTIEAKRGQLFISGKSFDIEHATVAFSGGKPDDPTISALARYDAPAGYTVYAEYVGTVQKGKLTLRADPSLTQDEIVTLLLFGSPDGSIGAGNGDSLSTAVSVAGGAAAQGLNRAISDVTNLDVSARVDTSTGSPRPELVLQVSPSVAAEVTQALGQPAPGESPDRT